MKQKNDAMVCMRVPPFIKKELITAAKGRGMSLSEYVRRILLAKTKKLEGQQS